MGAQYEEWGEEIRSLDKVVDYAEATCDVMRMEYVEAGKAQRAGAPTSEWTQSTISNTHPDDALSITDHHLAAYMSSRVHAVALNWG
jgi:hypothetical protein